MRFDFNDDQRAIREAARGLLAQRSLAARVHESAEAGVLDEQLWQEICELGWAGIGVPESLNGQGLGLIELCLVLEEQGATLSPTPLLPTSCASRLILHGGSLDQQQTWLPELTSGAACGGIGLLAGGAAIVAGAGEADVAVLTDYSVGLLLDLSDIELRPFDTIDALRSYREVEATGDVLPGDVARGLDEAAICVSAELLGVARHCLEVTVEYVQQRRQFGVPVGSFQAVSHKCAEMLYHVESARAAVFYAAWAADANAARLPEAAATAKYVASASALAVTAAAIQAHGGVGFTWEAGLHWWFKRAQLDAQLLGNPSFHRARIGEFVAERAERASNDAGLGRSTTPSVGAG